MTTLLIALALILTIVPASLAYSWLTNPETRVPDRGRHAAHTPWMTNGERLWHDLTHRRPTRAPKLHASVTWMPAEAPALVLPRVEARLRMTRCMTTGEFAWIAA